MATLSIQYRSKHREKIKKIYGKLPYNAYVKGKWIMYSYIVLSFFACGFALWLVTPKP